MMAVCECGSNKIENRDTMQCASCNRARRDAEKPVGVKEKKPLNQISDKRKAALKKRAEGYREVLKITTHCLGCGASRNLTPSHVLTQKKFPLHAANPANIVPLCGDTCHPLWENNKQLFRELCPEVWALKMHIMETLEPQYYEQFKAKHGL